MPRDKEKLPILLVIFLLLLGGLLLFASIGTFFGVFDPESPPMQNLKDGLVLLVCSLLILFAVFEKALKKRFTKKRTSSQPYRTPLIFRLSDNAKTQKTIATLLLLLFIAFIMIPISWTIRPTYQYSNNALILMWLVIFPLIAFDWQAAFKYKFKDLFKVGRFLLSACIVGYLFFYIEIIQSEFNFKEKELDVTIVNVSSNSDDDYCWQRATVKDAENYRQDFCIDDLLEHNLVNGDTAYIDNGKATLSLSEGWFGSVVDVITWHPNK